MKKYSVSLTALILLLIPLAAFAEVFYVDTDNVGTPVAMWDNQGTKVWEAEYLPFGEEYTTTKSPQDNKNRFVGKEKDKETGLTYFGARYFDEKSGRFLTPDPVRLVDPFTSKTNYKMLEDPQRLNRYAYGLNNPYRYIDPDGEYAVISAEIDEIKTEALRVSRESTRNIQMAVDIAVAVASEGMVQRGIVSKSGFINPADKLGMLGKNGAKFESKTVWSRGGARIDVENPNPGKRPGQIHYQEGKEKYLYDETKNIFQNAPNRVNEQLNKPDMQRSISKAKKYLGE